MRQWLVTVRGARKVLIIAEVVFAKHYRGALEVAIGLHPKVLAETALSISVEEIGEPAER
jgi:hypothetical protein